MLMIEAIRKHSSAWYTKVFLGLLALCFVVLWGGGDMLQRGFFGSGQTVVTVGSTTLSKRDFAQELQQSIRQLELQTGQQISLEDAKKAGVLSQVLRSIIQKELLDLECERLGLVVSDETIRKVTHGTSFFQDDSGVFQKEQFQTLLNRLNLSEASYIENMRGDLMRAQLITAISSGIHPPNSMVNRLYKWQNEKRVVKIISILGKSIQSVPQPKEEELKAFWEKNPGELFTAPEYRSFTSLIFGKKDAKVHVSGEKIQEIYGSRKDSEYKGKSLMQVEKSITKELEALGQTKALEDLRSQIEDMEASGSTLKEIADKFKLQLIVWKEMDASGKPKNLKEKNPSHSLKEVILETAFKTDPHEISDTIETFNGSYILVHVDSATPSQKTPLETIKEMVKVKWTEARRLNQAEDKAQQLVKKINTQGLKALKGYSYKTITVERQPTEASQEAGIAPQFNGRLFTLGKARKALSLSSRSQTGSMVIVLDKIIAADMKKTQDLEGFRERIRTMLVNDIITQYLATLEQRYRVEINKTALKSF